MTSTRNVAFIEVAPAAISTATSDGGQHDDDELVYKDCNLDIISDDTNDFVFDGIANLESVVKTDSAPLGYTRQLRSSPTAVVVPTAAVPATQQPSTTGAAAAVVGTKG